jgi:peroxiredoxin
MVIIASVAFGGSPLVRADDAPASKPEANPAQAAATPATPPAGHSLHGETFNEGPRQRAVLMGGTGNINFPVTSQVAEVQAFINQGVGQLHGFWYFEAERSFRQAAALDPDCATAYWGAAMANTNNRKRAKGFIAEAVKRKDKVSRHEQMYIEALDAYLTDKPNPGADADKERRRAIIRAYDKISLQFPDDLDAKAFIVLQAWDSRGSVPMDSYQVHDALLQDIFAVNPLHPAHHYCIHLWDGEKPERALKSSAMGGPAAPAIAHMWHMPGHIYAKLRRYHDAVYQQEASARVDYAQMMRYRILPDQIHNFAHNNEWLIRDLIYIGRAHAGLDMAKNMTELPRHPKHNSLKGGSARYGFQRQLEVLNAFEMWDDLIALAKSPHLDPADEADLRVSVWRSLGRANFRTGRTADGLAVLAQVETRLKEIEKERDEAKAKAEEEAKKQNKSEADVTKARDEAGNKFNGRVNPLKEALEEFTAFRRWSDGAHDEAQAAFKRAGSVPAPIEADLHFSAGQPEHAIVRLRDEVSRSDNQTAPFAQLVLALWRSGQHDEARSTFEKLRKISETIDLDVPVFDKLTPIAKQFGWPADWRLPLERPADIGDCPPLDSLGPFRWQPSAAPAWQLADHAAQPRSLSDFRGQPVVVIFYLGYGCLHCTEQLTKFGAAASKFDAAGIKLIAISTDTPEDLRRAVASYTNGEFPFPLVSDHKLDVFKAYRCHDDFEAKPLHGTFVIDPAGRTRWQDISFEPFMDPDFVLRETQRLLAIDPGTGGASGGS